MRYNCTLLKDIPEYPAGTTFTAEKIFLVYEWRYLCKFPGDAYKKQVFSNSIIDNPVWVRKEVDEACLTELKCSGCGSTKMELVLRPAPRRQEGRCLVYCKKLVGVCPCGCENELIEFDTHSEFEDN